MAKTKKHEKKRSTKTGKKSRSTKRPTKHSSSKHAKRQARKLKSVQKPKLAIKMPDPARYTQKELAKLTKAWYSKLKQSKSTEYPQGFDDIEWFDEATGWGQNSDYLKRPDQERIKHVKLNTLEYYRLCSNYLEHNKVWHSEYYYYVWKCYCDGSTYRKIIKLANKRFKYKRKYRHTLFYIHGAIQHMKAACMQWNLEAEEGLLNPNNVDLYVDDVPLRVREVAGST